MNCDEAKRLAADHEGGCLDNVRGNLMMLSVSLFLFVLALHVLFVILQLTKKYVL